MYHAGFCVLQERVIFQTHAGLLANTLKMKIGSEFSFLLKEGHGLAQASGLAISAECKNMDYSHSLGALKSNTDQYSFHVLLTHCLMCEHISQTCGLPVTTNFLCTTQSFWSTMVLALLTGGLDWPFSLCTMPSCGHVSLPGCCHATMGFHLY